MNLILYLGQFITDRVGEFESKNSVISLRKIQKEGKNYTEDSIIMDENQK